MPTILSDVHRSFPRSLLANARIVSSSVRDHFLPKSFPIHYRSITSPFDVIQSICSDLYFQEYGLDMEWLLVHYNAVARGNLAAGAREEKKLHGGSCSPVSTRLKYSWSLPQRSDIDCAPRCSGQSRIIKRLVCVGPRRCKLTAHA
jgi:hypothetical protein